MQSPKAEPKKIGNPKAALHQNAPPFFHLYRSAAINIQAPRSQIRQIQNSRPRIFSRRSTG